jgi:hypothetical protein
MGSYNDWGFLRKNEALSIKTRNLYPSNPSRGRVRKIYIRL